MMSDKDSLSGGSDKSRRRRLSKSSNSRPPFHGPNTGSFSVDSDSVTILSSPEAVYQVVSCFDSKKKSLVQSIGFGGILRMPCITNDYKKFAVWLLKRLNCGTGGLLVGDNFSITINPEHVGKISGLSFSGADIADNSLETVSEKTSFLNNRLAFLASKSGIVEASENFVIQDLPTVLSPEMADNFKIAFVVFVMGRFLAPSSDNPNGNTNFWCALEEPGKIGSYNWSSFVLSNILDAARLLNWVVPQKKSLTPIPGCVFILQLFYLDNIDFGQLNIPHGILPRWQTFSDLSIAAMIEADMIGTSIGCSTTEFGKSKMIREVQSCYSFGNINSTFSRAVPFTASPSINPYATRRKDKQTALTHESTRREPIIAFDDGSPLPTMMKTIANSIDKDVLDFGLFIRKKYQGQVDPRLLDDLKLHNAKCLHHLSTCYRSLAADIVNENTKLAVKLIENHSSFTAKNIVQDANDSPVGRRRRFNEFLSGTDSSTEGEDTISHYKLPRSRISSDSNQGIPLLSNTAAATQSTQSISLTKNADNSGSAMLKTQRTDAANSGSAMLKTQSNTGFLEPNNFVAPSVVTPSPRNNTTEPFMPPNTSLAPASRMSYIAADPKNKCSPSNFSLPSTTPDNIRNKAQLLNTAGIFTPEASIKMGNLSPHISPTSEHQSFSGACLSLRMLDSLTGIDLNTYTFEDEYNNSTEPKKSTNPGPLSLSHWEMKLQVTDIEPHTHCGFYKWLSKTDTNELHREWIVHYIPRFLKISGNELKEQFSLGKPMTLDTFDVAIRRIRQLDSAMYPSDIPLRWRHILESDYAMHALGSENPAENRSIRFQFVGSAIDYDVSRCRMFYVPVFVECNWWCYAWDMKTGVVFIIDPSDCNKGVAAIINKHSGSIKHLSHFLDNTARDLFIGWSPKFAQCHPSVISLVGMLHNRNDSGLATLFCIMHFDGRQLVLDPTEENLNNFRSYFLYQLLEIQNNGGQKPSALSHKG